jgi:hypothetical protein
MTDEPEDPDAMSDYDLEVLTTLLETAAVEQIEGQDAATLERLRRWAQAEAERRRRSGA